MVLPLFSFDQQAAPAVNSIVRLAGAEAKHAATVRRMRSGEGIQLANGAGLRVIGVVEVALPNQLDIRVTEVVTEGLPSPEMVLVQALAKGDRDELAIQAATELGVSAVIPWQADRSVSRWEGPKVAKGVDRWQAIVTEAAKQALRAFFPEVSQPVTTKQLAQAVSDFERVLVLDPTATVGLGSVSLPAAGKLAIVVGPEGGISEPELELLEKAGAVRVRLGAEILRTSTAGMAAISVLQQRLGRW